MKPRVKICGITQPGDATMAAVFGASAIGLVFWPSSPRYVTEEQARAIIAAVPPLVSVVGVFVNQVDEAKRLVVELGLSAVQFHGDETPTDCRNIGARVIKAVPVRDASALEAAAALPDDIMVLLDAHDPDKRGGTGKTINWEIAGQIAQQRLTILSGGLNPDNVAEAVRAVRPWAVDVSSGVEYQPGHKDIARMRAIFAEICV